MTTYVQQLASHGAAMDARALPPHILDRLRSFLLYNLAMAMAGYDEGDATWRAIRALPCAPGVSSILPTGEPVSAADAAFINAALVTARGQNDTLKDANGHIGCIVIPAVLALAQDRKAPMMEVLAALAAGYEVQAHAAKGAAAQAARRGFRATSVFGVLGAAAAASRVIGLSSERTAHALAIACNFAGGVMQCWAEGSMEWRFQVAQASRCGVLAALLAEQGITGATQALEGAAGLYRALGVDVPALELEQWRLVKVTFKPFPGCAINQGPVFTLLNLLEHGKIQSSDIARVDVHLTPDQAGYPGVANQGPFSTPASAVMSTAFMVSMALRDRALFQRHFTREYADAAVNFWGANVAVVPDPSVPAGSSRVVVRLNDGKQLSAACVDEENFVFSWADTVRLVVSVGPELPTLSGGDRIERLANAVGHIDETGVEELIGLCQM